MRFDADGFVAVMTPVLERFLAQNGVTPSDPSALDGLARRLFEVIRRRGLPPPLAPAEQGAPGSLPEEVFAPLAAEVLHTVTDPLLADAAKQLVKACFYPEFRVCRDSFCETTREGACRRQELPRVLRRISGTHCVDCPYWTTLATEPHRILLQSRWKSDLATFMAHRDVFLPEDFRTLRTWLHAAARA